MRHPLQQGFGPGTRFDAVLFSLQLEAPISMPRAAVPLRISRDVPRRAVAVATGRGVVLRKRYYLDRAGQAAEIMVNGESVGTWDLKA
ncbi:MAG: hypothetical protein O2923_04410 [Verrucomicrobia bacterium]|nr:hypothetical protein [Verrucomicrobiota bacterium]MDA1086624.1 hypothetical protein [Verrucomicrobiota bacterium]